MTDKQIIINKMDKPKRYCEGIDCAWCNEKEPCIYKIANELEEKLLRKEQECEELKKNVEHWKMEHKSAKAKAEWTYDLVKKRLGKQLNKLKAENTKYKQTLTEIKGLAENMNKECFYDDFDCMNCDMQNGCTYFNKKQILQKISEVEECKP